MAKAGLNLLLFLLVLAAVVTALLYTQQRRILFPAPAQYPQTAPAVFSLVHSETAAKLARVNAPVFLMHGNADTLVTPDNLERLHRARPDATIARVAGVGHELAYTAPAQAILAGWVGGLQ